VGPPQARPPEYRGAPVAPGRLYEHIGGGYRRHRRPDPRIAARLAEALGDAETVVNVGAGSGSYEPSDRRVTAVEPSTVMLTQRRGPPVPAVRALAEALPFPEGRFDAALAILTLHHWTDPAAGLRELRRVARRLVLLHFEPGSAYWLTDEYVPMLRDVEWRWVPGVADVLDAVGAARVEVLAVPHDCVDGFLAAYWRRPGAYLDPTVRASISNFARLDAALVEPGLARLREDLESGAWAERHADLLARDELDAGYRLIVTA
jgi:SAM-dependent methyltransferase